MAFPTIQTADTKNGTQTSNSNSWTLTYPTNIAAGDLLVAFVATDGNPTFTWPDAGAAQGQWSQQALTGSMVPSPGAVTLNCARRWCSGSETGTFALGLSASEQGAWRIFRISAATWIGGANNITTTDGDSATGTTANPDPPNLDPTSWATEDTLWFAACALDTSRTISVYPLPDLNTADVSGGSTGATLGVCTTNSATSSLNPGTFTISASDDWAAITFAVRPATSVRVPRSPGVDSGNAHFAKAWQAARRWKHGSHGILLPDTIFALPSAAPC